MGGTDAFLVAGGCFGCVRCVGEKSTPDAGGITVCFVSTTIVVGMSCLANIWDTFFTRGMVMHHRGGTFISDITK